MAMTNLTVDGAGTAELRLMTPWIDGHVMLQFQGAPE